MFLYKIQDHYFCLKLSNWLATGKISFDSDVAEKKNAGSFLLTSQTSRIKRTYKSRSLMVLQTNNLVLYMAKSFLIRHNYDLAD